MRFESEITALEELGRRLGTDFGRHELNQIKSAASALAQLAESGTSEQHIQRTTYAANKFQSALKRAKDSLAERENAGIQALHQSRLERLGMQTDKYVLPIIEAFRNAPDRKTRLEWLDQAVKDGHGPTLAALHEAPEFVSGIDGQTLDNYLETAESRHAPDLAEKRQQFDNDRAAVASALQVGERIAAQAVDLESIERAEQADKAEAELNAATS